jgi:hypothetical protein
MSALRTDGGNRTIDGSIIGAMPIGAVLRSAEYRALFKLLSVRLVFFTIGMLFRK